MTLRDATDAYIAWRQAHGARFISSARVLHYFCNHVGRDIGCDAVGEADVLRFLAGKGPLTRYRANKYGAPLSANITETPATFGISVGRRR